MKYLNTYRNLRVNGKVSVPRLTSNQIYIVKAIYEESPGVVTVDVGTTTGRGKVASVPAEDCHAVINEGSRRNFDLQRRLNG